MTTHTPFNIDLPKISPDACVILEKHLKAMRSAWGELVAKLPPIPDGWHWQPQSNAFDLPNGNIKITLTPMLVQEFDCDD